ncbi:hypothetical protein BL166_00026190 [Klebsiella pneumoniae]
MFFIRQKSICPPRSGGRYFYILSGAALAAASEGIFVIIHSCFKDKYFPCGEATQGIKEQGLRIYCGFDVLCLLLSEVISLRFFVDNRRRFYSDTLLGGVSGNPRKFRHSALWNFLGGWSAA